MKNLREMRDSFTEILIIAKTCLSTFWFWLPILYAACFYFQLWMIFFVHPITILILPLVLCLFMVLQEEKRVAAQYGLEKIRRLSPSHGLGAAPEVETFRWDVEKAVKEYEKSLKNERNKREKSN